MKNRLAKAVGPMREHMKYSKGRYVAKKPFATKEQAEKAITDPTLAAYRCGVCNSWHLGH